ncbi:hypothetical protein ACQP1S_10275 [Micromonospora matsumotoense]|uniref:hypothetical protein n=1 Tax=Micromonospora matsumotoense TaxID=121616 RepID=UPI003D8A0D35
MTELAAGPDHRRRAGAPLGGAAQPGAAVPGVAVAAGDLLHLTREASVQFSRPITVRVIRVLTGWHTYDGWVWIDAYELNGAGDAVRRRTLFLMPAGARRLTPQPGPPAGPARTAARQPGGEAAPPRPKAAPSRPKAAPLRTAGRQPGKAAVRPGPAVPQHRATADPQRPARPGPAPVRGSAVTR